jgi:hypothetical protein
MGLLYVWEILRPYRSREDVIEIEQIDETLDDDKRSREAREKGHGSWI